MREKLVDPIVTANPLGNKRYANNNARSRAIILQFVFRVCRDTVWKVAKNSPYLKDRGLQFKEDFSKMETGSNSSVCGQRSTSLVKQEKLTTLAPGHSSTEREDSTFLSNVKATLKVH